MPLAAQEELSVLASAPEDASEIDTVPPRPSSPQPKLESASPELTATCSVGTPDSLYAKGVAMRKEGRLRDAIDTLELAGASPSYMLKAQAQIGLCHRSMGDYEAAILALRAALSDQSASKKEVIDVQYFLAQTLESAGQMAEAATLYSRIALTNPLFKDVARRAKELSPMPKRPVNGKRETTRNGSWFGNVINSFSQLMGSRK